MTTPVLTAKIGKCDNKILDASGLLTATVLNTNIGEVWHKIPDNSGLVTTTVLTIKIWEAETKEPDHAEYITTPEFNKFTWAINDAILKEAELEMNSDLNTVWQRFIKNGDKIEKLKTFHLIFFLSKIFFGEDGFQNMFVYQ